MRLSFPTATPRELHCPFEKFCLKLSSQQWTLGGGVCILSQRSFNQQLSAFMAFKESGINCQSGRTTKLGSVTTCLSPNTPFNNTSESFKTFARTLKMYRNLTFCTGAKSYHFLPLFSRVLVHIIFFLSYYYSHSSSGSNENFLFPTSFLPLQSSHWMTKKTLNLFPIMRSWWE